MIKESSGAATKDTRSVDEGHKVYEEQRGCYEGHEVYEGQRGCYEND